MYDVIIIGAEPTGSTAAKVLAGSGYKVLLLKNSNCQGINHVQVIN